jgi:hypothetical protein
VVDVFSKQDPAIQVRSRKLLDYCKDYKAISINEYYTYNDWGLWTNRLHSETTKKLENNF